MKKLLFLLASAISAWAVPQQAVFTSTQYGQTTLSGSPYSTQATWRFDGRESAWTPPGSGSAFFLLNLVGSLSVFIKNESGVQTIELHDVVDGMVGGNFLLVTMPNQTGADMVWSVRKNFATSTISLYAWNVNGSNPQSASTTMSTPTSSFAGTLEIGDPAAAAGTIAFIRFYSTPAPADGLPPHGGPGGDLGDWEFNGNGNDSSAHGNTLTYSNGPIAYTTAPTYPPACNMPTISPASSTVTFGANSYLLGGSFRVGISQTFLTDAASFPLDGGNTLTVAWSQINEYYPNAGQTPPSTFSFLPSNTNASPTFTATTAGTYTIQQTVTDGSMNPTSCYAKYGAVATNGQGSVQFSNAQHAQVLAPVMWAGGQTYPFLVSTGVSMANLMIQKLQNASPYAFQFVDWWNYASAGMVTVTAGSATVTGLGTHFLNQYCGGSAGSALNINPTVVATPTGSGSGSSTTITVSSNVGISNGNQVVGAGITPGTTVTNVSGTTISLSLATSGTVSGTITFTASNITPYIVIWYPLPTSLYAAQKYGRWRTSVIACASDTSITLGQLYPNDGGSTVDNYIKDNSYVGGAGLNWSYADGSDNTGTTTITGLTSSSTAPVLSYTGTLAGALSGGNLLVGQHVQIPGSPCAVLTANGGLAVTAINTGAKTITLAGDSTGTGCAGATGTLVGVGGVGGWEYGPYPGNYYDNVMAFYNLYYATGLDDYLYWAQTMADRWFSYYDWGLGGAWGSTWQQNNGGQLDPRVAAPTGLYLRNADSNRLFDYSPGLALMANSYNNGNGALSNADCRSFSITTYQTCIEYDPRENGAQSMGVGLDALFNSSSGQQSTDQTAINRDIANRWAPNKITVGSGAVWDFFVDATGYSTWTNANFTASIQVGSPTVTSQNTYTWTPGNFTSGPFSSSNPPSTIWFTTLPGNSYYPGIPVSNASGDTVWYYVKYTTSTTLTLCDINGNAVNYAANTACSAGPTCTGVGWSVSGLLGFGMQPFMIGYQNSGFGFESLAISSTTAAQWTLQNAIWLAQVGLDQTTHPGYSYPTNGLYYGSRFVDCNPLAGGQFNSGSCWNGSPLSQRELNGEGIAAFVWAARLNPASVSAIKATGDLMQAAIWQCNTSAPDYSGICISGDIPGFMYPGLGQHKWFGYYWGIGRGFSWDVARLGSAGGAINGSGISGATIAQAGPEWRIPGRLYGQH